MESDSEDERAAKSSAWSRGLLIACWAFAGIVSLGILLAVLFPTFEHGRSARRSATLSNVKQVAIALLVYSADNDDRFPPLFDTTLDMKSALAYQKLSDDIFKSWNPAGAEIVPNEMLAGFPEPSVTEPAFTALDYENDDWPDTLGECFAFVDGHATFVRSKSLVRMEPRLSSSVSEFPPLFTAGDAMSYRFSLGEATYLLSWTRERTCYLTIEKLEKDGSWSDVYDGYTTGRPILRQDPDRLRLYLVQVWFQMGKKGPPPPGRDYYQVVTVDKKGVKTDTVEMKTIVE